MSQLVEFESLVLELLLIVSIVAIVVRRFKIPYTVALVIAGLGLSFRSRIQVELTPDLILALLLPPLVFEAAFHLNFNRLRQNYSTIALLAIPGVILTMLLVGGTVWLGTDMGPEIALVFGALIAATDPVSVIAIFRKLGAPKRLEVLLEGESLFNDGTAIVIFGLALGVYQTGQFNLVEGLLDFLRIGVGGLVVGLGLGWVVTQLIGRIDDYLIETTLSTVLAFGSFLIAEQLHLSGVLSVVAAGLVSGNLGEREMSPTTKIVVQNFWEYVAFLANSAVFLLIGLDIDIPALIGNWQPILWAIIGVLVSRVLAIYGLSRLGREIPAKWRHAMFWGGLRGAIALALALSIPTSIGGDRQLIILMTFGVVLFTLLIQGMTMQQLLKKLGLLTRSEEQVEYERRHARALAVRAGFDHLLLLNREGLISVPTWDRLKPLLQERMEALTSAVQEALASSPNLVADELITARKEAFRAQRSMLANLRRDGIIGEEVYAELVTEVDIALDASIEMPDRQLPQNRFFADICQLMMVVVQGRDLEAAANALAIRNIPVTRIRSSGGFLRQSNHLLLVGLLEGKLDSAMDALRQSCRSRVEFVSVPSAEFPVILADPVQVQVHGATVFLLEVERCEVL